MDNITIKLNKYGESLGTREIGGKLREEVLSFIKNGHKVIFDFSDINIISSAFADELFGKLYVSIGENVFKDNIKINNFKDEKAKELIILMINKGIDFRKNNPITE